MAEYTHIERHGLLEDENLEAKDQGSEEETPPDKVPRPFKRWYDSFRSRKRDSPNQRRYVEGWSDSSSHGSPRRRSSVSDSSQFGAVLTASTSVTSQSMLQSGASIRGRTAASVFSESDNSGNSPRPSSSHRLEEDTDTRATRRRHILRELVTTESDYVLGLKALTGVSHLSSRTYVVLGVADLWFATADSHHLQHSTRNIRQCSRDTQYTRTVPG